MRNTFERELQFFDHHLMGIDNVAVTFDPPTLTVKAGTTVTWVNADDIPHLVSEKDGKFHSSALDTGEKFSQTLSTAGTVKYFCAIHPQMTGKIIVTP